MDQIEQKITQMTTVQKNKYIPTSTPNQNIFLDFSIQFTPVCNTWVWAGENRGKHNFTQQRWGQSIIQVILRNIKMSYGSHNDDHHLVVTLFLKASALSVLHLETELLPRGVKNE